MKRMILSLAAGGSLLLAAVPGTAFAANDKDARIGSPQTQPNPSTFVTTYHDCLGPLRSEIAQGDFVGVGPFGEHFTGSVEPGAHYGSVGEAAFLENVLGLTPADCASLIDR
jgi:hypothetical protein